MCAHKSAIYLFGSFTISLTNDTIALAISIAKRRRVTLVVDDKEARSVANALGIRYLGTAGVLLLAYRQKHLSLGQFEDAIGDVTGVLWLSPTVVAAILKMAREET